MNFGSNSVSENSIQVAVPLEHTCFPDHFPGAPLVPGALLLQWIFASLGQAHNIRIDYIQHIKFLAPVVPGDNLTLGYAMADDSQLRFDCYRDQTLIAKGKLHYTVSLGNE